LAVRAGANADIWIWDIPHKTPTKLTFDETINLYPLWARDGERVVFYYLAGGGVGGAYWKSADGIGEAELLASKPDKAIIPWSFSRDGKIAAVYEYSLAPLGADIGMMSMEGDREIKELLHERHRELEPQISPDSRYMAYQSDESGKAQIYVRTFPEVTKGRWQVSSDGGGSPLWSPDGRELFYRNGNATMAVEVETDPTFKHGNPKVLFRGTYIFETALNVSFTPWDITPDGKHFLMIKPPAAPKSKTEETAAPAPQPKIIVVLNWFEELKDRVPTD
jgi:Tol biopolymer transport system component